MANEEDECDSSSPFAVASQSDVSSFLHAQASKITGLNSSISDDDDDDDDDDDQSSIDDGLLTKFTQFPSKKNSVLSRSCFASISSQKQNISDDLTELKWLSTFKLKEFQENKPNDDKKEKPTPSAHPSEDQISKLSNELKTYDLKHLNPDSISFGVLIFLALYAVRGEVQTPWSLTLKQIYEYIQHNIKQISNKRGWKNLLKETLNTIPCFVKMKHDTPKSPSSWTIDSYYRPLLTKAYLTNSSLQLNKSIPTNGNEEKQSQSIVKNFAPKATVKTKALPRLYERLCEENADNEDGDEADSNRTIKRQDRKRPRSSSSGQRQSTKNNTGKHLSSSSPWITKRHSNTEFQTSTPAKALSKSTLIPEHSISTKKSTADDDDDEYDSSLVTRPMRKSIITTRSQTAARDAKNDFVHRRKSSPPKKRLSLGLPSHRPNTRINRKIIEQDLELLRQAQPLDLSHRPKSSNVSAEDILDLSLTR